VFVVVSVSGPMNLEKKEEEEEGRRAKTSNRSRKIRVEKSGEHQVTGCALAGSAKALTAEQWVSS
jgi:hypothetical protein